MPFVEMRPGAAWQAKMTMSLVAMHSWLSMFLRCLEGCHTGTTPTNTLGEKHYRRMKRLAVVSECAAAVGLCGRRNRTHGHGQRLAATVRTS